MNRSKRDAGAVVFEGSVLDAQRREQFALDKSSRRLRVAPGCIADHPRQQYEIAVCVSPLGSGLCAQARICREGGLVRHVVLHLSVGVEEGCESRFQRLAAADAAHHAQ
jgi:hypothetical protein